MTGFTYPTPARDETLVDDYHGHKVTDPYRFMEDPKAEQTKAFIEAENIITQSFINSCEKRELIKQELTELWDYPKYGCMHRQGSKYFFSKNSGLQNQSVIYVQETLDGEPQVFLDPNTLSEEGTISLTHTSWSHDGSTLAYGLSQSGSDWVSVKFKNVETKEDYPDTLEKIKFSSITWTHDNKGVFYSCYPLHDPAGTEGTNTKSLGHHKLYYHRLGTDQAQDVLCVEFPEKPTWMVGSTLSHCGRYLFVSTSKECKYNIMYYCDLEDQAKDGITSKFNLTLIVPDKFEADYEYVTNTGPKAIFRTNKGAVNFKLVSIDLNNPAVDAWVDVLPQHDKDVLEWAEAVAGDKLVTCYMQHVKNTMQLRSLSGEIIHSFQLNIGSVTGFSGDIRYTEIFYKFSSQIHPGTIYRVDLNSSTIKSEVLIETQVKGFKPEDFRVEQVFYPSKDGTEVPMFITMRKDFVPDGTAPCLLYGYGGFSISLTPSFSTSHTYYVQHFGIMAIANIRGGGEYGENWNNAGSKEKLQNCLTDFQSAAEYLVKEKYTTNSKLAIFGGSHGGMLVAACGNQRPDLYGAVIAAVGVMDLLRFHKHTIGYAWVSNYGSSDNETEFRNLLTISPLHNVRRREEGRYPAVLLLTGDHDDRVVPSHTLKYIATLQHTLGTLQEAPLLVRVDTKTGHGAGKPSFKSIEEYTDIFSFLVKALGITYRP